MLQWLLIFWLQISIRLLPYIKFTHKPIGQITPPKVFLNWQINQHQIMRTKLQKCSDFLKGLMPEKPIGIVAMKENKTWKKENWKMLEASGFAFWVLRNANNVLIEVITNKIFNGFFNLFKDIQKINVLTKLKINNI